MTQADITTQTDITAEVTEALSHNDGFLTTTGLAKALHKLTLVQPDGSERPCFEIASPEQAQALAAAMIPAEAA